MDVADTYGEGGLGCIGVGQCTRGSDNQDGERYASHYNTKDQYKRGEYRKSDEDLESRAGNLNTPHTGHVACLVITQPPY